MKSVFIKYITTFAVIIVISFLMLSSIITVSIDDYAMDARENDVTLVAQITAALIEDEYQKDESTPLAAFIENNANRPNRILAAVAPYAEKTALFIVDTSGAVLINPSANPLITITSIHADIIAKLVQDGSYSEFGRLDGKLPRPHIVYATPISKTSGEVVGAVFACTADVGADALIKPLTQSIVLANLWVMLAVMIAVYFITERMLTPLRDMRQAAREFADGNFAARIRVTEQDEIAELATAFNQMADSLAQSETMRSTFLANVSHDLRTPMTTIAGYIDGILDGVIPSERQSHYLGIVSSEVHRLSRLVSQLLDISRMEAGIRTFSAAPFDLCEVARLALLSFESKIEQKKLEVEFDAEDDPMPVHADRDAIHQILYNLLENAIKFSYDGGRLSLSIRAGERGRYTVRVYNEGNGVSAEDLPYIFDRFYKSDKSRGLDKVGVGLGLYIVKTMLTACGESICAESEEGRYCAFEFTIRRADPHALQKPQDN